MPYEIEKVCAWVMRVSDPQLNGQTGRRVTTPLRTFLRTEAGSAGVLLAAILVALVWANVADGGYERFWETDLSIHLGSAELALTLREWVNSLSLIHI